MKLQVKAGMFLFFFLCMEAGFCVNAQEPVFEKDKEVYLIQSAEDMRTLAELVNRNKEVEPGVAAHSASYRLTCDVDLSAYCTGEEGWEPIGYRNYKDDSLHAGYFNGTFDGGNHVVTGLYINRPEEQGQGLFGTRVDLRGKDSEEYAGRETTLIKNLYIKDCDITGAYNTGGVMGGMWNFLQYEGGDLFIENCHVTGKIVSEENCAGGIAGSASTVKNCSFTGTVEASSAGGIAGKVYYVYGCAVHADVSGSSEVGGIGGWAVCVRNSYMAGSVKGYDSVGGITGFGACLTGCYTKADVWGYSRTGGLIGDIQSMNAPSPKGASSVCTIQNCLMGGYRMGREAESDLDVYYPTNDRYNGYIYGFPGVGIDDRSTSAFYYREGLEAKGFGEFSDWNCEPYDCTRLEEADFKDLLERPEENWADVWYCATDYAWPNLTWEKESRFGYTVTVTVQEGDSLWKLADLVYGDGYFWTQIYDKNKECIGGDPNLIHPGMDLEVVLNASLADYAAKGDIYQQEGDFLLTEWKKGLSGTEIQSFYRRLLADDLWNGATWRQKGMPEDYNRRINDWMIADLDGNGQKDMIVIAGDGGADCPGEIWLYLNEEPAYVLKDETAYYEENFGFSSFCINPLMADLDNDGNLELLFGVITDGVGRAICLFRHVGNRWEECQTELPDYNDSWLESGIGIRVNTIDTTKNVYEAYCPYLEERREFTAKSWKEYFVNTDSGEQKTGSNVWGMYGFQCVDYKGKNALQFKEKLMWDGSYVLGGVIGDAVFILNWDADGVCRVADWWAEGDD